MKLHFLLAVLVSSLVLAPPAFAKAPTASVTVTGPRLQQPLQLADEEIVAANVWAGNFADWESGVVKNPEVADAAYHVHFWVRFDADDIQLKYVLDFQWLAEEQRGVICLPGRDDPWYYVNVYSILRTGQDGNCFYAAAEWGEALQAALSAH